MRLRTVAPLAGGLIVVSCALLPGLVLAQGNPPPAAAIATPIGKIVTAKGLVKVEHVAVVAVQVSVGGSAQAKVGDLVYQGDVVSTGVNSAVGIIFSDGAAFNLASGGRIVLNEFVFDPKGTSNSTLFTLSKGIFTVIAGKVARTGDMKIETPVATMGIRGTIAHVEIRDDAEAAFSTLIEDKKAIEKALEKITAPIVEPVKKQRQAKAVEPAAGKLPMAAPASPAEQSRQVKNADSKPARKGNSAYDINVTPKICAAC
jgi:hypothetical protein